jgi:hypothetical protein
MIAVSVAALQRELNAHDDSVTSVLRARHPVAGGRQRRRGTLSPGDDAADQQPRPG